MRFYCPLLCSLWRAINHRLDLLEPLIVANIALAVMFVGRPLNDLITAGAFHQRYYDILPTFDEALLVALIGVLFFQLGYLAPVAAAWSRYLPAPPPLRPQRTVLAGWLYLIMGGVLFGTFLAQQGGLGLVLVLLQGRQHSNNDLFLGSTGYFYNGILMWGAASLVFFAVAVVTSRKIYWLYFLPPTLSLLLLYGAQGTRSNLLPLALAIPVFWYLWKSRRPRARTLIVGGVVGVALLGWLREVRNAEVQRDFKGSLVTALTSPVDQALDILGGSDAEMFDAMANELLVIPERTPFQHGATVTDVLIRAVPRLVWPNKPLESNDVIVNALWPQHYATSRASPAFSIIGIFYADTAYVTVALGMLGIVALSRSLR